MGVAEQYTPELKTYVGRLFGDEDLVLERIKSETAAHGLPPIEVGADEGRFLRVMAQAVGAKRALEIGTLAGYSAVWIARGLGPEGRLTTLEVNPEHAQLARQNLADAGLDDRVEVVEGPALESLAAMAESGDVTFDYVFIDADKEAYPDYLDWALRLTRPGAVILAHNVYLGGDIVDGADSERVRGVQAFNHRLATEPRLDATIVPLRDGMSVAIVRGGS